MQQALGGAYAIERELGRGGMGAVYLARDLSLDRLVAIKVLPPELAVRHELRERFLRESRTTAAFSHPHIVPVHAIVEQPQLLGYVMGYVEGESVAAWVARTGPLGARDVVRLLREVAWGLSYAHGRGIVHRDVKPDNILVERATGRALVTDFGIARSRRGERPDGGGRSGRHAAIHEPGAGGRRYPRWSKRHLFARRGRLVRPHREGTVRCDVCRCHHGDAPDPAAAAAGARSAPTFPEKSWRS